MKMTNSSQLEADMKILLKTLLIGLGVITTSLNANAKPSDIYINKYVGFNVEGYSYQQPALPCDVDNKLVNLLAERGQKSDFAVEVVDTKEKINNGTIPVVLIDIEKLVLDEKHNYGVDTNYHLPKIQITAGLLQGSDIETAKHTCAIATSSSQLVMPTDKVEFDHPAQTNTTCMRVQRCLEDLSKDVFDWIKPQVK